MKKRLIILTLSGCMIVLLVVLGFRESKTEVQQLEEKLQEFNYVIGTQTVGSKYKFTKQTNLVETAKAIKDMGSNLLKFSMHPRYCTENYDLPKNENIKSLKDLATLEPSMKEVLEMDFRYYHIWVYGFSQYTPEPEGEKNDTTQIKFIGGFSDEHADALYTELYEFTSYLLTEFDKSEKVFYLGHWEGDWHLRWHYDRTKEVEPETLAGMIKWEKTRQKAIDDAKRDHPNSNVEIYNYIEVNLVRLGMEEAGYKNVTNSVIPEVNPDYVSYSSYDATNPYDKEEELNQNLKESLNYIESYLKEKPGLPEGKRVWIGEYGNPSIKYSDEEQDMRSKWTIKAGLEWGTPFILYWEMYNNEIKQQTEEQVGYWLIDDQNNKQKVWYTHNSFYEEASNYIKDYYERYEKVPSELEFLNAASEFNSLSVE